MSDDELHHVIHGIHASNSDKWVVIRWEDRGLEPREVIVVKSDVGYADSLEEVFAEHPKQRIIYFDTGTQCQDQDVVGDVKYYYTLFAQLPDGRWQRQGTEHVHTKKTLKEYERIEFFEDGTLMKKVDTLRIGLLNQGGYGAGGF
jgi:hypothetical protein